ncbi:E3 SUMO-protein ligase KIAA1586-like [Epinephelus fuscoguttatus]|uniref:E3 SUMO-protein ligase KIAA1586-like n=1 Tax=Epinephelus fuscoguttatus TaxID=293821 RepID=UPI0020D11A72|nr:E3 SUMO-protein ligase KIAA1586-like [Epinephelus fuscoguttatus]
MIYCTYLVDGKPVNRLIQIVTLDHARSQGILDAILKGLKVVGVQEEDLKLRLVGFGCDGASVMLGLNNGVAARLKHLCPSLVAIWCVAHRLELTALDCLKVLPQLRELNELLRVIHKHYTVSSKASRELEEISKAMEVSILRPGNTEGTRWLPHTSHALEALMRNYKPLLVHFENHASDPNDREASAAMKGRARLILKSLKQYRTLLFIHLMLDILQELKHLVPERRPHTPDGLGWAADNMHGFCSYAGVTAQSQSCMIYLWFLVMKLLKLFVHVQCRQTQAQG